LQVRTINTDNRSSHVKETSNNWLRGYIALQRHATTINAASLPKHITNFPPNPSSNITVPHVNH
jgi:hypothetical protein